MSACLFTCNDPFPGILYTFKTGDICGCGGPAEHLVYVTDESGNILDVRVYKSNQTVQLLTLKQPVPGRINITTVRYTTGGSWTDINTRLGVISSSKPDPDPASNPFGSPKEWMSLTVNNFPGTMYGDFLISSPEPRGYGASISVNNNILTSGIPLYSKADNVFFSAYRNENWVYYEKDITSDKSPITLDFNSDFTPMSNFITVNYGLGSSGTINGYKRSAADKLLQHNLSRKSGTLYKLGYNSGYDYYYTSVSATFENGVSQQYEKLGGPPPPDIPFLNYTLNVQNEDIHNFRFVLSGSYMSRRSFWQHNEAGHYVSSNIDSPPDGQQNLRQVFADLKNRYPDLRLDELVYYNSIFRFNRGSGPINYAELNNPPANFAPNNEQFTLTFSKQQ